MASDLRQLEKTAKQDVHASLLDLGAGLPSRKCRFRDLQVAGQLLLGEAKRLTLAPDLGGAQETNLGAQGLRNPLVGLVVQDDRAAVRALQNLEIGNRDRVF